MRLVEPFLVLGELLLAVRDAVLVTRGCPSGWVWRLVLVTLLAATAPPVGDRRTGTVSS